MQKFELAPELAEGPVYGAGGVAVDRRKEGAWNDGEAETTFMGQVLRHGLLYHFEVGDIVWREDLDFLPAGSVIAADVEDPCCKPLGGDWYMGTDRIPEDVLPGLARLLRIGWEYPE